MEMRTERISGIPAPSYLLSAFYRILIRFGNNLNLPALILILKFLHPFGNGRNKTAQMPVNSRISIMIADIKHIPRTVSHPNTRDITIGKGTNRFADHTSCFKIQPAMKVVGTDFTEISAQCKRKIKRGYKSRLLFFLPITSDAASQHQSSDILFYHSILFFTSGKCTLFQLNYEISGKNDAIRG